MLQTATIAATITTVVSVDAVFVDWSLAAAARAAAARGGDIAAEGAAGLARIRHPLQLRWRHTDVKCGVLPTSIDPEH